MEPRGSRSHPFRTLTRLCLLLSLLAAGCRAVPTVQLRITDRDGAPAAGVAATFTSSPGVWLSPASEPSAHELVAETDAGGVVTVAYCPPDAPGFWARLFGAWPGDHEWIRVRYVDSDGRTVEHRISVYAR